MTLVKKDREEKIIVDYETDFVHHSYLIIFEIYKLPLQSKKLRRKTQVVIVYNM